MTRSKDKTVIVVMPADDWTQALAIAEEYGRESLTLNVRFPSLTTVTERLVLVVGSGTVMALCLGRSLGRSGDLDTRVRYSNLFSLDVPVPVEELWDEVPDSRLRLKAQEYLSGGGVVPERTEDALMRGLIRLRPEVSSGLRRILAARKDQATVSTNRHRILAEQRDAVALALEIAGFDSRLIVPEPTDADVPFLSGLDEGGTSEAAIIRHDATHFEGWALTDTPVHDVVTLHDPAQPRRTVTVVYTDKEPLEKLTGTDLIYYRNTNPGFVLVQYKRMERLPKENTLAEWGYRPDAQLEKDFERMREWRSEESISNPDEWRLSQEPFYFKLVENNMRRPEGNKLVKGMYFPRPLFELLQDSDRIKGPRGGKIIGWQNAERYLEKDEFVSLLQRGWIGSAGDVTQRLNSIVKHALDRKRGVFVVRDDTDPDVAKLHRKLR